jgi:hypothetical protein
MRHVLPYLRVGQQALAAATHRNPVDYDEMQAASTVRAQQDVHQQLLLMTFAYHSVHINEHSCFLAHEFWA